VPRVLRRAGPEFADVVDTKMSRSIARLATSQVASARRRPNDRSSGRIAVAVANVDAHVSAPAATVTETGTLVAIMARALPHRPGRRRAGNPGACGVVADGVVPGLFGYEAGQSAVGDIFGWFVEHCVPPAFHDRARERGVGVHEILEEDAALLRPGQSGLLALDWWNGNRSILVDADLSGVLVGLTLATTAPESTEP